MTELTQRESATAAARRAPWMRPASAGHDRALLMRLFLPVLLALLESGCAVTIDHTDVFANSDAHVSADDVKLPATVARSSVSEFSLQVGDRRFLGYRLSSGKASRAMLFMPGNGYGAARALSRLAQEFHDESTDLYLVSYFQPGEPQPRVEQVLAMSEALARYASANSAVPISHLIGVGHSLGGWVTLHLAGLPHVGCAVVVGSGTTAAATATQLVTPRMLAAALSFRASEDVALLDNERLARASRIPTLVVGSQQDEVMPPETAQAIFESLPAASPRALYISPSAAHAAYFRDEQVLKEIKAFMRSKCPA